MGIYFFYPQMTQMSAWLAFIAKLKNKAILCNSASTEGSVCFSVFLAFVKIQISLFRIIDQIILW